MASRRHSISLAFTGEDSGLQAVVTRSERAIDRFAKEVKQSSVSMAASAANNKKYEQSLQSIVSKYDPAKRAAQEYKSEIKALQRALDDGNLSLKQHEKYVSAAKDNYADTKNRISGVADAQDKLTTSTQRSASAFSALASAVSLAAIGGAAKTALQAADNFRLLESRIKLATEKTNDFDHVMGTLIDQSKKVGVSLESTVDLFSGISRAAGEMGKGNAELLKFSNTVQKLGVASGASAERMKMSLLQMSQSFAGGIVRAEEFNSVVENTPEIAFAMARGLEKSLGEVRMQMLDGKLTAVDMFDAIISQSEEANRKFAEMPVTMERATNTMKTSASQLADVFLNDVLGATDGVAGGIRELSDTLDDVRALFVEVPGAAEAAAAVLGGVLLAAVTRLSYAIAGLAGPIGVAVAALGTLIAKAYSYQKTMQQVQLTVTSEMGQLVKSGDSQEKAFAKNIAGYQHNIGLLQKSLGEIEAAEGKNSAAYKQTEKSLNTLVKQMQQASEAQYASNKASAHGEKEIKKLTAATASAGKATEKTTKAKKEAKSATEKYNEAAEKLYLSLDKNHKATLEYRDGIEKLNSLLSRGEISTEQYETALNALVDQYKKATGVTAQAEEATKKYEQAQKAAQKETENLRNEIQRIEESLFPAIAAQRKYEEQVYAVNNAVLEGIYTEQQASAVLARLRMEVEQTANSTGELGEAFDAVFGGVLENFLGFDEELTGGFSGMLDGLMELVEGSELGDSISGIFNSDFMKGFGSGGKDYADTSDMSGMEMAGGTAKNAFLAYQSQQSDASYAGEGAAVGAAIGAWLGSGNKAAMQAGAAIGGWLGGQQGKEWSSERVEFRANGGDVQGYEQFKKPGLLGSSFKWKDAESGTEQDLESLFDTWEQFAQTMGQSIGRTEGQIDAAIDNIGGTINFATASLSPQQIQAKLENWVDEVGTELINNISPEYGRVMQAAGDRAQEVAQALMSAGRDGVGLVLQHTNALEGYIRSAGDRSVEMVNALIEVGTGGLRMLQNQVPHYQDWLMRVGNQSAELLVALNDLGTYITTDAAPAVRETMMQALASQRASLDEMLADFDGSVASTQEIAETVKLRAQMEKEALRAIEDMKNGVTRSFIELNTSITESAMSSRELYNKYMDEVRRVREGLSGATDPAEIQRLSERAHNALNIAFQNLSGAVDERTAEWVAASERQIATFDQESAERLHAARAQVAEEMAERASLGKMLGMSEAQIEAERQAMLDAAAAAETERRQALVDSQERMLAQFDSMEDRMRQNLADSALEMGKLARERLNAAEAQIKNDHVEISQIIRENMNAAANSQISAANNLNAAANSLRGTLQGAQYGNAHGPLVLPIQPRLLLADTGT